MLCDLQKWLIKAKFMATNPMHQFEVHRIGPSLSINGMDLHLQIQAFYAD